MRIPLCVCATLIAVVAGASPHATAIETLEVRKPEGELRYRGELTRGYAPCLAPNDVTLDGLPACSPPVTSMCAFVDGRVELHVRGDFDSRVGLSARLNGVVGPGNCPDGPYTLELRLRVTAADAACAAGRCTFEDVVVSQPLDFKIHNDFVFGEVLLDELVPIEITGLHYEVLGATINGPDGRPVAATGIGFNGTSVLAPMGAGYARCEVPNESGVLGPACNPPAWPSSCDTTGGLVEWHDASSGIPVLKASFQKLGGPSPDCADGEYVVNSRLRVTTGCVGTTLCTAVDVTASIPVVAKHGKISSVFPIGSLSAFATLMLSMEVQDIDMQDPSGALFATPSVNDAWDLQQPKVVLALRNPLSVTDDRLRLEARFPLTDIDPNQTPGVTFTITDRNGPVYQVTIPAGLWQLGEPVGTRWDFADRVGNLNGVTKASIQQLTKGLDPIGFRVRLEAKNVDLSAADLPGVNVLISIPPPGGFTVKTAQRNRICKVAGHSLHCK